MNLTFLEEVKNMRFEKETENKIREVFRQEDFQNFMFEAVFGESKDEYD